MSAETITYNGYAMTNARISIREQFVYDSDERTLIGTQYGITVQGWINGTSTDSFRMNLLTARAALSQSYKQLTVKDAAAGVTILDLNPDSYSGESSVHDYSPKVVDLTISEIAGLQAARYTWSAEAFRKDCGALLAGAVAGILSIQRTYSYSIDAAGYATRAVAGTLKCTRQAAPADQYRSLVDPPLPTRFRPIQKQFSQSPDNRTLTFNVVHQELFATLPTQIPEGEATWGVKIADMGARIFYVLNGRFRGGPTTPKSSLFQALLDLVNSKFPLTDPTLIFEEASVDDTVYDNEISFSIVASGVIATLSNSTQIFNSLFKGMTIPPPKSNGQSFNPGPYGALPGTPHIAKGQPFVDACSGLPAQDVVAPQSIETSVEDGIAIPGGGGWSDVVTQDGAGPQNLLTPFVDFEERIAYHFDYKVSAMDRKDDGADPTGQGPLFVAASRPSLVAVQAGYLKVYAKSSLDIPNPPEPIWGSAGQLLSSVITPDAGQPVADGIWKLYTVHWRHVIAYATYMSTNSAGNIRVPSDPRTLSFEVAPWQGEMSWLDGPEAA